MPDEKMIPENQPDQTPAPENIDDVIMGGRAAIAKALQDDAQGGGQDELKGDGPEDANETPTEEPDEGEGPVIPGEEAGDEDEPENQEGDGTGEDDLESLDPESLWDRAQQETDAAKAKAIMAVYKEKLEKRFHDTQTAFHERGEELARLRDERIKSESSRFQKSDDELEALYDDDPDGLQKYLVEKSRLFDLSDKEEELLGAINPKELIKAAKRSDERKALQEQQAVDALQNDLTNTETNLIDFVAETWNVKTDKRRSWRDQGDDFLKVLKSDDWVKVDQKAAQMYGNIGRDGKVRPPAGGFTKGMFQDAYKLVHHDRIVSEAVKKARAQVLSQIERAGSGGSKFDRAPGAGASKGPSFGKMTADEAANLGYTQRKQYLEWLDKNNM
jgi:hypothetical protein